MLICLFYQFVGDFKKTVKQDVVAHLEYSKINEINFEYILRKP